VRPGQPCPALLFFDQGVAGCAPMLSRVIQYDASQPSRLLEPMRGVVEFTGRTAEIARLVAWCEDDGAPRLRLITTDSILCKSATIFATTKAV
jgi:hypothetical protein